MKTGGQMVVEGSYSPKVPSFDDLDVSGPTTCVSLRDIAPPPEDVASDIHAYGEKTTVREHGGAELRGDVPVGEGICAGHAAVTEAFAHAARSHLLELVQKPMSPRCDACHRWDVGELEEVLWLLP